MRTVLHGATVVSRSDHDASAVTRLQGLLRIACVYVWACLYLCDRPPSILDCSHYCRPDRAAGACTSRLELTAESEFLMDALIGTSFHSTEVNSGGMDLPGGLKLLLGLTSAHLTCPVGFGDHGIHCRNFMPTGKCTSVFSHFPLKRIIIKLSWERMLPIR
jgi:hypothetical protein